MTRSTATGRRRATYARAIRARRTSQEIATERLRDAARTRTARSRRTSQEVTTDRLRDAARARTTRSRRTSQEVTTDRLRDAARARTTRSRRTSEAVVAERLRHTARARTTRSRRTSEAVSAERLRHTARARASRARARQPQVQQRDGAEQTSARRWANLPVHKTPFPNPLKLGSTHPCRHCGIVLLRGEEESFCCRDGSIVLQPLPHLPPGWPKMFRNKAFRKNSWKYNNLFCFTAMGVSGELGFVHQNSPSCVKIHGRTYHCILPANQHGPVQWYVHDPQLARAEEADRLMLNATYVMTIGQTLNEVNLYARNLHALG